MHFPERIVALRQENNLTEQVLADKVEEHLNQIQRYESGRLAARAGRYPAPCDCAVG
jgi:ribosome-binding protein aMBF1 (putative translation factor)